MIRAAEDFPSFFHISEEIPFIIDCGANIGVSMLEWKYRWPASRILCFEPDPFAFEILTANIEKNDLPNVTCVCAAISDTAGTALFHGEIHRGADSRGNSLRPEWGKRENTNQTQVRCLPLSDYLNNEKVAFLKIDIEGMEEAVLRQISPFLGNVNAAYIEVHGTDALQPANSVERIRQILLDAEFDIEIEQRFQPHALPPHLQCWQQKTNAMQSQILCWR